jgi:hypothetical protein
MDEKLVAAALLAHGNFSWLPFSPVSPKFDTFAWIVRVGVLLFRPKHAILSDMVKRFIFHVPAAAEIAPMAMCMMQSLSPCPGRGRSGDV